jgi:hypothetical protein
MRTACGNVWMRQRALYCHEGHVMLYCLFGVPEEISTSRREEALTSSWRVLLKTALLAPMVVNRFFKQVSTSAGSEHVLHAEQWDNPLSIKIRR